MKRLKPDSQRKTPSLLDAIVKAAEAVGEDGNGKAGLVGYLTRLARTEPKAFSRLLYRVIPLQTQESPEVATEKEYRTVEEIEEEMRKRGIKVVSMFDE